jgi:hypothetical protein
VKKIPHFENWQQSNNTSWEYAEEAWGDSESDWELMQRFKRRHWVATSEVKYRLLQMVDPDGIHTFV